jgi:nicotinamide mononucleotide (NMN) deamidase PncC
MRVFWRIEASAGLADHIARGVKWAMCVKWAISVVIFRGLSGGEAAEDAGIKSTAIISGQADFLKERAIQVDGQCLSGLGIVEPT